MAVAETLARAGDFDVFLLAGRYTLLDRTRQSFLPYCVEKDIGVVIGGPSIRAFWQPGPNTAPSTITRRRASQYWSGSQDSGDLQGAWRQARRGGAALSPQPSRDRLGDPGGQKPGESAAMPR